MLGIVGKLHLCAFTHRALLPRIRGCHRPAQPCVRIGRGIEARNKLGITGASFENHLRGVKVLDATGFYVGKPGVYVSLERLREGGTEEQSRKMLL